VSTGRGLDLGAGGGAATTGAGGFDGVAFGGGLTTGGFDSDFFAGALTAGGRGSRIDVRGSFWGFPVLGSRPSILDAAGGFDSGFSAGALVFGGGTGAGAGAAAAGGTGAGLLTGAGTGGAFRARVLVGAGEASFTGAEGDHRTQAMSPTAPAAAAAIVSVERVIRGLSDL